MTNSKFPVSLTSLGSSSSDATHSPGHSSCRSMAVNTGLTHYNTSCGFSALAQPTASEASVGVKGKHW
ncbi:hypothetical protein E2C01_005153 [Portunus trituberculatus]|uniref:Uncharacterized protein n=1 Tax=Portunus trituberculatus TaxID=210409 RepID=A0A5B7CT88_PORTR|nr:hypothetical protein [Portunus trituberculatus]